jgi:hypothetical protein
MPNITRRTWALSALGGIALIGLSSCGDDDCHGCFNYIGNSGYASEVSYGLVAGNFAKNGLNSIVATSIINNGSQPNPGNLKFYLATGPLAYAAPVLTADGNNPLYLSAAVLTSDGLLDVVSANAQDGTLAVFFNNAQTPGTFNSPLVLDSPGASQLAIADMNGDGQPDLISADFNVSLFLQSSAGTFASPITLYSGGANWVAAGDLNHDGSPDIALTDNVGVKLLFHTGAASTTTFAAPVAIYNESSTASISGANLIAIADVNGDGYNDLIITDPGPAGGSAPFVAVLLQNAASPGTFLAPVTYATAPGSLAQTIQVTDINGDGHPDIVIGGSGAVSVLLNDASTPGTFAAASNYAVKNANQIAIADVNGDGLVDIIIATGASSTLTNGVYTNLPGVLLQNSATPGTFMALQNL